MEELTYPPASFDDIGDGADDEELREFLQKCRAEQFLDHLPVHEQPVYSTQPNTADHPAMETLNFNSVAQNLSSPNYPSALGSFSATRDQLTTPQLWHGIASDHHLDLSSQTLISSNPTVPNSSSATINANNLEQSAPILPTSCTSNSSWMTTLLQSLQPQYHVTNPPSASYSRMNLLLNEDDPRDLAASTGNMSLEELMEQLNNDFISYGASGGSLQEQLSSAISASDNMLLMGRELHHRRDDPISAMEGGQTMLPSPTSSVSSDGRLDDDSTSHKDGTMKDVQERQSMGGSAMAASSLLQQIDDKYLMQDVSYAKDPLIASESSTSYNGNTFMQAARDCDPAPVRTDEQEEKSRRGAGRTAERSVANKKPKRERGSKLAIRIESEVDILDDGYKWRKYGQKPVKNSPYARSYYRCTDKQCKVKKHVERQANEPVYVVITYEGAHSHAQPDHQPQGFHSSSNIEPHFQNASTMAPTSQDANSMHLFGLHTSPLFQPNFQPHKFSLDEPFYNPHDIHDDIHDVKEQVPLDDIFLQEPRSYI